MLIPCLMLLLATSAPWQISAQGIQGKVFDQEGKPLSYTAIAEVGAQRGTASNAEGDYFLDLAPGTHRVRFQFLGYRTIDTTFTIASAIIRYNPVMRAESIALPEAIVTPGNEDPAYTIMRRAIAKAKYHTMQVNAYNAMVYVKGSGRLLQTPWLFRKQINKALAEEGIDSTVAFTQESVSKLHYIRPDQYRDTVVSIRTTGDDNNTSPMSFIYSSFYEPKVVTAVSPLAPDAFAHYRFQYLGYIVDRGQNINKIKVTPKGKGDQVFEGVIYIVDNNWSIHSLDLSTSLWGIRFGIQQQFSPILPDVWMPVHEVYDVDGKVFGFSFEYKYFASLNNYRIRLNPDLEVPVIVLDGKLRPEEARAADKKITMNVKPDIAGLDPNTELSAKKLRRMVRDYEKAELEAMPESDTVNLGTASSEQYIDSTAYKRDTTYWSQVRPLPLTHYEVRGYVRQDSLAALPPEADPKERDDAADTLSLRFGADGFTAEVQRRKKFEILHLFSGGRYDLGEKAFLKLKAPLQTANFNTVDGYHFGYELDFGNREKREINWLAGAEAHYALARKALNYAGHVKIFGKTWSAEIRGGNMTAQYGYSHPIPRWANSFYSLFVNDNYMKLFEQRFGSLSYSQQISRGFGFDASVMYADRHRLVNTTDFIVFDNKNRLYSANDPVTVAADGDIYSDHEAIISNLSVWTRPFWRWQVSNGNKRKNYGDSPKLTVNYRKGWGEDYQPFDLLSGVLEYKVPVGAGSLISMKIGAGKFLGEDRPAYFHDFAHMPGNQMIASPLNPVFAFRNLNYYLYSTDEEYAYGLFNYQFRRFALTQFHYFRRQGMRENVLFNTLLTPESNQYMEVGYALNYILRFFRVEFVTSWQEFEYRDFAVRLGVATDFQSIFNF